jgi:hypothetical protein
MSIGDVSSSDMQRLLRLIDRDPLQLDERTVERLLDGTLPADDAPPAYRGVAHVMSVLTRPGSEIELTGETGAVASITAQLDRDARPARPRPIVPTKRRVLQVATASLVGGAMLVSGLAAAGALPGAAQSIASDMLEKVGVSVPGPNNHAGAHPDVRGQSNPTGQPAGSSDPGPSVSAQNGQGSTISDLAHTTTATGVDKGAAISTAASDGQSQAGDHGGGSQSAGGAPPANTPGVSVPNTGGTSTADTASDGHSTAGTATANLSSDGHSQAGSANATDGLSHKP